MGKDGMLTSAGRFRGTFVVLFPSSHLSSRLVGADKVDVAHSSGCPVPLFRLHPAGFPPGGFLQRLIYGGAAGAAQPDAEGNWN